MSKLKPKSRYPTASTTYNVPVLAYLKPAQAKELAELSERTGIPKARLLRDGVDMVLAKYGAAKKRGAP